MKSLLVYLKNYKCESVFAPLFKMLEALFELIVPLVIASIIDIGIANKDLKYIIKRCLLLVLFAVIGLTVSITAQFFAAKAATGFSKELKHSLFAKIQTLSFTELDKIGTSSLITRLTADVNQIQNGVNIGLRLLLRSPFIVIGAMIMAYSVDRKSSVIFIVITILLSVVIFGIIAYTIPKYKSVQNNLDILTLKTRENLNGTRVIRAFTEEKNEVDDFKNKNDFLTGIQKSVGKISALMNPLTYVILNIGIVLVIYLGGIEVNVGNLSQGEVVALYNYMSQILGELLQLATLIISVTKIFPSASRVEYVFKIENSQKNNKSSIKKQSKQTDNEVDFVNVSFKYDGDSEDSLTNINFSAKKGEIIGIIGGTGSGKTSLVSLIPRFYNVTNGSVLLNGIDVNLYSKDELISKIGFVFQNSVLFKGSLRENLKWGNNNASDENMKNALVKAQIYNEMMQKNGLDTEIEQNGSNLSGGQKQRISIARALVKKPEILVFDDSFSALDLATESSLSNEIYNLKYKPTVFIVSQRANSVIKADKIIVLDDGIMVGIGKHNDLLKTCEVYKEIYESQFQKEVNYE